MTGVRTPIPPVFARALAAIEGLEKLAAKAKWRMTRSERTAVEAATACIVELRDELRERNQQLFRMRAAVKTLVEGWKEPEA